MMATRILYHRELTWQMTLLGSTLLLALAVYFAPVPKQNVTSSDAVRIAPLPILSTQTTLPALTQLTSRPLFTSLRRMRPLSIPVAKPIILAQLPTTDGMILRGVLLAPDRQIALVSLPGTNHEVSLMAGDMIGQWRVAAIGRDRVVVTADSRTAVLVLGRQALTTRTVTTTNIPSPSTLPTMIPPPPPRAPR